MIRAGTTRIAQVAPEQEGTSSWLSRSVVVDPHVLPYAPIPRPFLSPAPPIKPYLWSLEPPPHLYPSPSVPRLPTSARFSHTAFPPDISKDAIIAHDKQSADQHSFVPPLLSFLTWPRPCLNRKLDAHPSDRGHTPSTDVATRVSS